MFSLVLALCLVVCLAVGSAGHAADAIGGGEDVADVWHADGDHHQVPADGDKNAPHQHSICHGHDLTAAPRFCTPFVFQRDALPRPAAEAAPPGGAPAFPLRPPIA